MSSAARGPVAAPPRGGSNRADALPALRVALALSAGAGLLLGFPPYGLWWAAPAGLGALVAACRGASTRVAWLLGLASGLVLFLPLLEWTRYVGTGAWVLLALLEASVAALLGPAVVLAYRAGDRLRVMPASVVRTFALAGALAGAVVAVEAVRARVPFGGLTWGRMAFSQSDGPLLAWAAVGGAPGVSAATALLAAGGLELVDRAFAGRRAGGGLGPAALRAVPAALLVLGPVGLAGVVRTPVTGVPVRVAAVQGNVPGTGLDAFAEDLVVLDNHVRETERLAAAVAAGTEPAPDLVVWPENAADQDPRTEPATRQRVDRAVAALGGRQILLGAVLRDGSGRTSNGLLTWGRQGPGADVYRKRHLVPFGEYLPLRSFVTAVYPRAGRLLARDFTPGRGVGRVTLSGVPLAVGTCFEVAFDDLPRAAVLAGGELIVLPSNNASYGRSGQSAQQLAMARLRAVEHSRSTVVATTSGISALVRPDGAVVARSGLYEPAVLTATLPRRTALTFATRHGGAVEAGLSALVLLAGLGIRRPARPARGKPPVRRRPGRNGAPTVVRIP